MKNHFFISYAHEDKDYVMHLASDLQRHGFDVWRDDDRLNYGKVWQRQVENAIRTCKGLFAVMTLNAESSEWVHRELSLALEDKKPIFPLLLSGRPFFMLNHLLYVDVTNGQMPSPVDYARWQRSLSLTVPNELVSLAPNSGSVKRKNMNLDVCILTVLYEYYRLHPGAPQLNITRLAVECEREHMAILQEIFRLQELGWVDFSLTTSGDAGLVWLTSAGTQVALQLPT